MTMIIYHHTNPLKVQCFYMFYNNTYMSHRIISKSKISKISSRLLIKHCMHQNHTSYRTVFQYGHIFTLPHNMQTKTTVGIFSLTEVKSHKLCQCLYTSFPLLKIYERFMNSHHALVSCAFLILTDFSLRCKNFSTPK